MKSPIQNKVGMVFIPVSDMDAAIDWYSRLLGLPKGTAAHEGTIYDLPMEGETGVILDSTKPEIRNSSQPLLFLWTDDIEASYRFLQENDIPIVSEVEDIGSVMTLTFTDPDDNLLMVCQRNPG